MSCEIPASRKVAGFLGHNATLGCNKCYIIIRVGNEQDFSGFNRTLRESRVMFMIYSILEEVTKTGISSSESKYGV